MRPLITITICVVIGFGFAGGRAEAADARKFSVTPGNPTIITYRSEALRGHAVYAHFGLDGWNRPFTGDGAGSEDDRGNRNFYVHRRMREADGVFTLAVALPSDARALHAAFCWDDCGAGHWDNAGGEDYAHAFTFPYIGPVLTWNEATAPESGVVVSFETTAPAAGWLELTGEDGSARRLTNAAGTRHRFVVTDLAPATRYSYRVGAGDEASPTYSFRTAPRPDDVTSVRFLVFGDAQDNGENGRFARLAAQVARDHQDVDFVLSTGDLPWNDRAADWWSFFDKGRPLFATKVVMPVPGNHDTPTVDSNPDHRSYLRHFALPRTTVDRAHYRWRFGPAEFLAMNSERPAELAAGGGQYRFIEEALRAERPAWRFAYWHVPPFDAGQRHVTQQLQFRDVARLFDGALDWHFGGHEHLYQRFQPLRLASGTPRVQPSYADGVGYVIVPSSGVPASTLLVSRAEHGDLLDLLAAAKPGAVGYLRVELDGRRFALTTYALPEGDGAAVPIDRVAYEK